MPDRYQDYNGGLEGPATHAFTISPNDGADLVETTRAIYVGAPGSLTLVLQSGAEVAFANVTAATVLPVRATRVKASGTTASSMVGMV